MLKKTVYFIKKFLRNVLLIYFYVTKNKQNKSVYFVSKNLRYSDNQRSISEALYTIAPEIIQIWQGCDNDFPPYIRIVKSYIGKLKSMAQSDAWVIDLSEAWKPKSILNIATWHGDRGFKKVLYDIDDPINRFVIYEERTINGMDLYLSGSEYGNSMARNAMRYKGEIQMLGCPRNDRLVKINQYTDKILDIKKHLHIPHDTKIVLYAPTFRDLELEGIQHIDLDINKTIDILQKDGTTWICLIRAHSITKGFNKVCSDKVIDVSQYPDMTDLLMISDLLITDYSSCCCDFILTNRPCVLIQFDKDIYEKESRSFSVNPADTGFIIANTKQEFEEIITNLSLYDHLKIAERINDYFGTIETGNSSMATAQRIKDWIYKNGRK